MWALALKNLQRDRRRTIITMAAVAAGIIALLLFCAYIRFIEGALASTVIYQDGNGHVQVYRSGGPENLSAFPARYSLDADDQRLVRRHVAGDDVVRVSAQMIGVGLIHRGAKSAVFLARGVDFAADAAMQRDAGYAAADAGGPRDDAVLVTRQLADLLGLERASDGDAQLSAATYGNRFNAVDVALAGNFTTGIEAIEDKSVKTSLRLLQSLYDTDAVSRLVVQLDDRAGADRFGAALGAALERERPGRYVVTTWHSPQVGQIYNSFMGFLNMMFVFTGTIVLVIAVTTVQHTIATNVADRMREIGVLRALGFGRRAVVGIFVRESVLIACIAAAAAALAAYLVFALIGALGVTTLLPRVANPVPLALKLPPAVAAAIVAVAIAATVFAAWITALRSVVATVRTAKLPLARVLAGSAALLLLTMAPVMHAAPGPDEQTLREWLKRADRARGAFANYAWSVRIHSVEPSGATDTRYAVAVNDGKALVRTVEPPRYQGEKMLLTGRAMWYIKPGLRRPVSVSPQQRLVGEAANGDIASVQYSRDYRPTYLGEETVDGRECYKIKLVALNEMVTYEMIVYYVDKQELVGVKADLMTASGEVFKVARFQYRNQIQHDGAELPFISAMKIINVAFPNRFSTLEYSDVRRVSNPESMFMLNNLMSL